MPKESKKRASRFAITQLVDVSGNKEDFYQAQGINISTTGLLCEVNEPPEIQSEMYIMLSIDGEDEALEIQGTVRRVEKKGKAYHVAINFFELIDEDIELLEKFIAQNK